MLAKNAAVCNIRDRFMAKYCVHEISCWIFTRHTTRSFVFLWYYDHNNCPLL